MESKVQKLSNFKQENKLGLNFLGQKIGEKIGNNVQKLTDFKEKKDFSGQKKTSWG